MVSTEVTLSELKACLHAEYIGCNSSIIGGEIVIGDNAVIGAHALVLKDVEEGCRYITKVVAEIKRPKID
uniref:WenN n=1 Tax=Proteus vulgaris TaxID=585 RepID=A0A385JMW1_PROVU|nr:wenN [Proteus vulgaris]